MKATSPARLSQTGGAYRRTALAAREHQRWVSELKVFYEAGPDPDDRREDLEWQTLASETFERPD